MLPLFAVAQTTHTVQAKETLYSLARKYNVHPRELAEYNNISVQTGLTLGQVIRIPSKTTMAPLTVPPPPKAEAVAEKKELPKPVTAQKEEAKTVVPVKNETSFPIYHKVEKKETLYHISKTYNNVSIADLKKWNKLTSDGLSEGTKLIVGYSKTNNTPATVTSEVPESPKMKTSDVVKQQEDPKTAVKEPVKEVVTVIPPVKQQETANVTRKDFNGGVFKTLYTQQVANKTAIAEERGTAGIFKSTSGWEDGKYYCLSNSVQAGTIVKVTNPATQKFVYAKVLDLIPDLKQNAGLILRISNAAAQELGTSAESFDCTLNF